MDIKEQDLDNIEFETLEERLHVLSSFLRKFKPRMLIIFKATLATAVLAAQYDARMRYARLNSFQRFFARLATRLDGACSRLRAESRRLREEAKSS